VQVDIGEAVFLAQQGQHFVAAANRDILAPATAGYGQHALYIDGRIAPELVKEQAVILLHMLWLCADHDIVDARHEEDLLRPQVLNVVEPRGKGLDALAEKA